MEKPDYFRNYGLVTDEMKNDLRQINAISDNEKRFEAMVEFVYQQQKLALMNERDAVEEALMPDRNRVIG